MKILHIDTSINGTNSVTRALSASIVETLTARNPRASVVHRDLGAGPLPHFTLEAFADSSAVDEFLSADVIVLGAPMYNFGVPSQLKAWLDRIAIPGKTFRYTENGPEGLAGGRRLIVASSRGGFYGPASPTAAFEHQESYLRAFFSFLGVTDITFVQAEGVNRGPDVRSKALEQAHGEVLRLAA